MDSERGPVSAGPRIVYILSCGGLSVSALGIIKKNNNNNFFIFIQSSLIFGGYIAPSHVLKFFSMCLGYPFHLSKMNRDVLEQVYILYS